MVVMLVAVHAIVFAASAQTADYGVVPMPQRIEMQRGDPFVLDADVQILAGEGLQQEALFLQVYLKELNGLSLPIAQKRQKKVNYIELTLLPKVTGPEGYVLTVRKNGVTIAGESAAGVFYGIQTLRKSLFTDSIVYSQNLPAVRISDAPRFSWRGMHLDCSRHFWSVDFVKKFIDLLALHNMNVFHWHLTDDQGWRIEIKKWPRLTTVGSQRSGTIIGTNSDMPGHMLAALAAYPELGCTGGPYQVGHYWGVYKDVLCVGNPRVYEFVQDVLTEVMDIFPSEVIHIGGDETPSEKWQHCKKCNEIYIKKTLEGRVAGQVEGDSVRSVLQPYFTNKVFNILASKGRRALGWDEILDGAPQDAMIMSWRGTAPGAKAAEAGHDVVMAPTTHCYFDYQQVEDTQFEPSRCGGFIPIERVYSLDPAPDSLSVEARSHILGTQANLWSEYMTNEQMVEYQALPRMSALAEVQWTQPERKDYNAFLQRLTRFTSLFERYHYIYAKHLWPDRQIPNRWQF